MDRRDFLTLKKSPRPKQPVHVRNLRGINSGLNPYTGPWTVTEVTHLLKRTMFGAKKTDVDYFKSLSFNQAIDALLNIPGTLPPPPLKDYDNSGIPAADPDYAIPTGQTWVNTFSTDGTVNAYRKRSLKSWWVGLMLNQDRNILEKMVLFWHNHFSTETNVYDRGIYGYNHFSLLRQQGLGNFKQLVRAITIDPAMLVYLNGNQNTNTAPDENYARELQELFTLGKENTPNYTEDDVKAAARVLTGWRTKGTDDTSFFQPSRHDVTNKQFSSFYGNTVITGRSGTTAGDQELDDLLNMIFSKSVEVSEFIVRKLYRWFCYYVIDSDTETNVIKPLAQQFRNGNWEIKPVLDTLLRSEHFFDVLNYGAFIKSPLDLLIGMCREFAVVFPASGDYVNEYNMWDFLGFSSSTMQQTPGDPPNVSGWPAFYQIPNFYELWISSDTIQKRFNFANTIIMNGYTRNGFKIQVDPVEFAKTLPNPGDPNALIDDSLQLMYRVPLSDASKLTIKKQILLSNQDQDYYWSNAWYAYVTNPTDPMAYQTVYQRLRDLYRYLVNLAEYQLS